MDKAELSQLKMNDIAAAPMSVRLAGKQYTMRPLDEDGYIKFEKWVQNRFAKVGLKNAQEFVDDPEERLQLMRDVLTKAATITVTGPESLTLMTSLEGAAKLVFLYLCRDNEITEKEVAKLLVDPTTLAEAMTMIDEAEGFMKSMQAAMEASFKAAEKDGVEAGKKAMATKKKKFKKRTHRRH